MQAKGRSCEGLGGGRGKGRRRGKSGEVVATEEEKADQRGSSVSVLCEFQENCVPSMTMNDINLPNNLLFVNVRSSADQTHSEDLAVSASDPLIRVRKPYTITKHREKWTKEEHEKFLEAIKLYGRAWRRIQEHIGTKTAIQIRSHAQKFFSKVDRKADTGKSIDIPPPRPKRKPLHPYPRKLGHGCTATVPNAKSPENSSFTIPSFSEQESGSPVSVLSLFRSDTSGSFFSKTRSICASPSSTGVGLDPMDVSMSDSENGCCSPTSSALIDNKILVLGLETSSSTKLDEAMPGPDMDPKDSNTSVEAQPTSVKLFGRTLLISNSGKACSSNDQKTNMDTHIQAPSLAHISPCEASCRLTTSSIAPDAAAHSMCHFLEFQSQGVQMNSNAEVFAPVPFWSFFGSRLSPLPFTTTQQDMRAKRKAPLNATGHLTMEKENYNTDTSTSSSSAWNETETAIDDVNRSVEGQGVSALQVHRCSTTRRLKRSKYSAFSPVETTNQYMNKELSALT
ncbi:hypothetical protein ZIOFF_015856 [Zingiber officinale]|uniref:Uncharacterized protein n=1 Tax=Zingiber officinale TaxID=94328 RepID=A0A8J5LUB0_ZINOF|nr:hypothetical protein ZIOFF_015856 [Zingiber officinale]